MLKSQFNALNLLIPTSSQYGCQDGGYKTNTGTGYNTKYANMQGICYYLCYYGYSDVSRFKYLCVKSYKRSPGDIGQSCPGVVSLSIQNSALNSNELIPMLLEMY